MIRKLIFPLTLALLAAPAFAQDEEDEAAAAGRRVVYKSKTEIDFEAVEVAGELVKPQGALLLDRKRGSFNPLIKLRADFNDEMDASVDEIK
jgi:hypothetical protein